ncbi:carboxypeptidase M32 [Phototrophicus methaneseepsis]|uniref:Metal-dependent carboxypeptidase n=1 Tax=Phototrophicus methaneseepsis TaxID=2710758 RepID=A0A7S8ECH9_9CHLR|nr:carboxypeptidase M32 [Phototrophicus methaneseepsis]QPC84437.1 carboxypeptidase M32 [Phototrophicus methaneseepsis]
MGAHYEALLAHLKEISNIRNAAALLSYDQETAMPPGGAASRAQQLSTLSKIGHEMFTSGKTSELLNAAAEEVTSEDYDSDAASMVRVVQEDYAEATKLPSDFVADLSRETSLAHATWAKARQDKDFKAFLPALERIIGMMQKQADLIGYEDHPYDALLGQYERGMTTAQVRDIFDAQRPKLVDLISAISEATPVDDSMLKQPFDRDKQRDFALEVVKAYGFDFERGAQAQAVHPFCTSFSVNDVRITTRFNDNWLNPALFGMMHESGHGMYNQGIGQNLEGTPLAEGTSLGVHESQSRMWENIVGRSKGFWSWALPKLQETFPQLNDVSLDDFYKAVNKVERSFIRVEADEATYNLHIILRFELEQDLLTGAIKVADVRDAWNDKFNAFFGMTPPDDALGVLQDVHWSGGLFGYFATYALGNLLSVQYYNEALKAHPSIPDEIANGQFNTLLTWLNQNIHQHGRKYTGDELTRRITGEGIQSDSYIQYLTEKFGGIYGL